MAVQQTQTVQNQVGFAPEIAPFGQQLLGQSQALTDVNTNPYMQYQGARVAQFAPLQNQSYDNAALMQSQPQLQDATATAGSAALGALNTQYTYNPFQAKSFTSPGTAQSYMSPYMQNVVDVQQQEARRQAGITDQSRGAQFARSGAFGGGRQAIENAEANRNLNTQLGNIQAQGSQAAYQQGQQQFNAEQGATQNAAQLNAQQGQFGAGLGLQGLQTAMTGAQGLGQLGQLQYGQNMGINALQNQYGMQQQNQIQKDLDVKFGDYTNAQNYPYKQLGFMSDIIRGAPLSKLGSSVYEPAPSMLNQLAGVGTSLFGLGQMGQRMAGGGAVQEDQQPAGLSDLALYQMLSKMG